MTGPRVGDKGTEIILHIVEGGEPVDLAGASAVIEILGPAGRQQYAATVQGSSVRYTGKRDDDLWPRAGVYTIRAVVSWADGRRFMSKDVRVTVG